MCGIFGILKKRSPIDQADLDVAKAAAASMIRRGPDDEGFWSNEHVAFAFRRLSIIDLSPAGHQPMVSACGRFSIVFNGELYNFQDLKKELIAKGVVFRSLSDTEVVLSALITWGPTALSRFNGMFAIGFWNDIDKTLTIARDHVGMKPLYFTNHGERFVFGSQLDTIINSSLKKDLTLDTTGLGLFLSVGYYPSPRTVFREIKQLEPGAWLSVDVTGAIKEGKFFDLHAFYLTHKDNQPTQNELKEAIKAAVNAHLMSDVPIGTFLSGGLDSGIITAFVQQLIGDEFTSFTLSIPGSPYDETSRALDAAKSLKIPHRLVVAENLIATIQLYSKAYQEPFGDYSAIPALLVTQTARREVKVLLSGDGSDEFFFGYNRMKSMLQSAGYYRLPLLVRRAIKRLSPKTPAITHSSLHMMLLKSQSNSWSDIFRQLNLNEEDLAEEFVRPFSAYPGLDNDMLIKLNTIHRYFQLQLLKLDRASMYNSVEARVPFADKNLLKYTIAYTAKDVTLDNYSDRKIPLQNIYSELYPAMQKQNGRKMGFTVDMKSSFSGELHDYYADQLEHNSLFGGYLDLKKIRTGFLNGSLDNEHFNWGMLSLQLWSAEYWS